MTKYISCTQNTTQNISIFWIKKTKSIAQMKQAKNTTKMLNCSRQTSKNTTNTSKRIQINWMWSNTNNEAIRESKSSYHLELKGRSTYHKLHIVKTVSQKVVLVLDESDVVKPLTNRLHRAPRSYKWVQRKAFKKRVTIHAIAAAVRLR